MVGTTKRSIATMPSAWLRRNVFHRCEGGPLIRAIYLATLVWPISMPSLRSSPWILGAPHNGLAMLISRISRRISNSTVGRPQRFRDFQRLLTPRCTKGGCKLDDRQRMPGAGLSCRRSRKAPLGKPTFQPYWGKPAVRNDRGDRGDVGIIRSPLRASILPDSHSQALVDAVAKRGATVKEIEPKLDTIRLHQVYVLLLRAATSVRTSEEDVKRWGQTLTEIDAAKEPYLNLTVRGNKLPHRDWLKLNNERHGLRRAFAAFFADWDILLCPAAASAAWPHDQEGE